MNTDEDNIPQDTPATSPQGNPEPADSSGQALTDLVDAMNSVDTDAPDAEANATSMNDNRGGRIEYVEDDTNKLDSLNKNSQ